MLLRGPPLFFYDVQMKIKNNYLALIVFEISIFSRPKYTYFIVKPENINFYKISQIMKEFQKHLYFLYFLIEKSLKRIDIAAEIISCKNK